MSFAALALAAPRAAYVHLPFCRKRCHYCDFPIVAIGRHRVDAAAQQYCALLHREMEATPNIGETGRDYGQHNRPRNVASQNPQDVSGRKIKKHTHIHSYTFKLYRLPRIYLFIASDP